jgi:hypothetical protein
MPTLPISPPFPLDAPNTAQGGDVAAEPHATGETAAPGRGAAAPSMPVGRTAHAGGHIDAMLPQPPSGGVSGAGAGTVVAPEQQLLAPAAMPTNSSQAASGAAPPAPTCAAGSADPSDRLLTAGLEAWLNDPTTTDAENLDRDAFVKLVLNASVRDRDEIIVASDLDIRHLEHITCIPDGLTVRGNFMVAGMPRLESLGTGLWVNGTLSAADCPELLHIGEDLRVMGSCYLSNCPKLRRLLPLHVQYDLVARDTGLRELPDVLQVTHDLDFSGSRWLRILPQWLSVGGSLILDNCPELMNLPMQVAVGEHLSIRNCPNIRFFVRPEAFAGTTNRAEQRRLYVAGAGLSPRYLQRLQSGTLGGVRIVTAADALASVASAVAFWFDLGRQGGAVDLVEPNLAQWGLTAQQAHNLVVYLGRLRHTADYASVPGRALLAERVARLLAASDADVALRSLGLGLIEDALDSCVDGAVTQLDHWHEGLRMQAALEGRLEAPALRAYGVAVYKLQVVETHIVTKCAASPALEPVEVRLRYLTLLQPRLDLPLATQAMKFPGLAGVTAAEVELAYEDARQAAADEQRVTEFLSTWEPWKRQLRREAAEAYASWHAIPQRALPKDVDLNLQCVFSTRTLGEMLADPAGEPVCVFSGVQLRAFNRADLLRWWVVHGTAEAKQPLMIEDIYRPKLA